MFNEILMCPERDDVGSVLILLITIKQTDLDFLIKDNGFKTLLTARKPFTQDS